MFVEAAFPFTDLRSFYLDHCGRAPLPRWPTPRVKEPNHSPDFVRGMGAVASRPRGGVTGRAGEDKLCDADRAIVFPESTSCLRVRFRRFFADGGMFARLSVGMTGDPENLADMAPSRRLLDAALKHVMTLPARIGPARLGFPQRGLIFIGSDLARYVPYRTTKHTPITHRIDNRGNGRWKDGPLYVCAEAPMLLVEARRWELSDVPHEKVAPAAYTRLLKSASPIVSLASLPDAHVPAGLADVVAWTAMAPDGGQVRCFLLLHDDSSVSALDTTPTIRALRIYLLRLIAERQNIRRLFEWLDKVDGSNPERGLDDQAIEKAFTDADRTLRHLESKTGVTSQLAEHLAGDYIESVHPGESESLRASVERIFTRRNVRAKAYAFLENDKERVQVVQNFLAGSMGVGKMGDDFRKANITAGAVGSQATATNTTIQGVSQQNVAGDAALATELVTLVAAMRAEAKTPGEEIAAEQVEKAADAAKEGKGEHVLAYLKTAGSWALSISEKIGVEVAKSAISKSLGMP